jgi:hypothetical protein
MTARYDDRVRPGRRRAVLTAADWRLVISVAFAQVIVAAALRAMQLRILRARAARVHRFAQWAAHGSEQRIVWAIEATGRRLGGISTCLVRALVAELVLDSPGPPLRLMIGVKRSTSGTLAAHAWLARDDRVLIGATSDDYLPLVGWNSLRT